MSTTPALPEEPELLPTDEAIEEEVIQDYDWKQWYPAYVGEVIHGEYKVICKLGWGRSSTVWFARRLGRPEEAERYVSLKLVVNYLKNRREIEMLKKIAVAKPGHPGLSHIRLLLDSFDVDGPYGTHSCLVLPILREPLHVYQTRFVGERFPLTLVRRYLKILLLALSYLHDECKLVHTDIKPENILLGFEPPFNLASIEEGEIAEPAPRKVLPDHTTYRSVQDLGEAFEVGDPKLIDFDHALPLEEGEFYHHFSQVNSYRAPEVTLGQPWWYPVDIWNLGVMTWDLLENRPLCEGSVGPGTFLPERQIAQMVGLLGNPPNKLVRGKRGLKTGRFFDDRGELLSHLHSMVPTYTLNDTVTEIEGAEKVEFLRFTRRMLQWCPEDRATATELLEDHFMSEIVL